jgi:hypothetical protein
MWIFRDCTAFKHYEMTKIVLKTAAHRQSGRDANVAFFLIDLKRKETDENPRNG